MYKQRIKSLCRKIIPKWIKTNSAHRRFCPTIVDFLSWGHISLEVTKQIEFLIDFHLLLFSCPEKTAQMIVNMIDKRALLRLPSRFLSSLFSWIDWFRGNFLGFYTFLILPGIDHVHILLGSRVLWESSNIWWSAKELTRCDLRASGKSRVWERKKKGD